MAGFVGAFAGGGRVLGRYGVSLGTYEGPAHDARDVVESFSNLSLSSSLADIESLPVPQWVKDTAEFALKNLEDSARIIRMGEQWNEFAATDEGKKFMEEHGGLADALQAVGVSTESVSARRGWMPRRNWMWRWCTRTLLPAGLRGMPR